MTELVVQGIYVLAACGFLAYLLLDQEEEQVAWSMPLIWNVSFSPEGSVTRFYQERCDRRSFVVCEIEQEGFLVIYLNTVPTRRIEVREWQEPNRRARMPIRCITVTQLFTFLRSLCNETFSSNEIHFATRVTQFLGS
jgi:hypothetical protein